MNKPKAPVLVTIISWLMLFSGISTSFSFVYILMSKFMTTMYRSVSDLDSVNKKISLGLGSFDYINMAIFAIIGVGIIIVGYGIGRMRKWALYGFTFLTLIVVIMAVYSYALSSKQNLVNLLSPVVQVLALIYLWKISKKFV
jgi:hypothetical protein